MRIIKTFVVETHEEYGTRGLRALDMPNADPLTGRAVAHDLLEHFPNDDGSTEHELMALGASLWLRTEDYYGRNGRYITDPAENIASDFRAQYYYMEQRGRTTILDPGRTQRLTSDVEDALERVLGFVRKEFRHDDEPEMLAWINKGQGERMCGWMRKGYRRAALRYKGINHYRVLGLFIDIEEEVDKRLPHLEEGANIRISVSPTAGDFTIHEDEVQYDYD